MDYSRKKECDTSQGGNEYLYLFPYNSVDTSLIELEGNLITNFPLTTIYSLGATAISFDEDVEDAPDVTFDQNLTFQVSKIMQSDNFVELICQDFCFIVRDNNGNIRLLGYDTGMVGKYKKTTGVNRSDFNGYSFTFTTKENKTAPFLTDLSFFEIENHLQDLLQYLI